MNRAQRKAQIKADAEREAPDTGLADYADLRGLSHRGNSTQIGFMAALDQGEASKGATRTLEGETFPVSRGAMGRDPNTDELLGVLAQSATPA